MKVKILGAHNIESKDTGYACLLVDDILVLDAGAVTSNLSFEEQKKLRAVLLTHRHFDHIRDIPCLGMNFNFLGEQLDVYTPQTVYEDLSAYFLDGKLYPDFSQRPPGKPSLKFYIVEIGRDESIDGYTILPVTVNHAIPCVGYQVTSVDGKKLFYTSDTGPGLAECWRQISPDLLVIELTSINKYQDFCVDVGHLTPALLQKELESFRDIKGYLPRVVTVHANPMDIRELEAELSEVARILKADIQLGREGMEIVI